MRTRTIRKLHTSILTAELLNQISTFQTKDKTGIEFDKNCPLLSMIFNNVTEQKVETAEVVLN